MSFWDKISSNWKSIIFGPFAQKKLNVLEGYLNKHTGAGLTPAEREANAFTEHLADKQMQFQQQMRDSQYQSAVADMRAAGINPALAYQQGGNVAPAGAGGHSVAPSVSDLSGLLGQIANLKLLDAQRRNIESETDVNLQSVNESKSRIEQIRANIENLSAQNDVLSANARKLGLEGDALDVTNAWLEREKLVFYRAAQLANTLTAEQISEVQARIDNIDADTRKKLQEILESKQRIRNLIAEESLTEKQQEELVARIDKVEQETKNLVKDGKMTEKDIEFYEWNHSVEELTGFGPNTPGKRYIPVGEDLRRMKEFGYNKRKHNYERKKTPW